jgi:hypothetical protein
MSLAEQYGYHDEDLEFGGPSDTEQTVEQEYQAFVTALLSAKYTDILKFWEVSHVVSCAPDDIDRLYRCRSAEILSQPFLRWLWITSLSKHMLSLVSVSFPQVPKPIQSGGIVSTLT